MLAGVAVDAVFDSVSVATTFKDKLEEQGIIFCPFSEAVREHPELVKKYLGSGRALLGQLLRRRSTRRCSPTAPSSTSPRACAAPWSSRRTSASTRSTGSVRAHAHHRRGRRLRQLPGRLHRADARREPAARRRGRAGRARRRPDQVLDGPELVPRRQGRQGRHLQLRHQARRKCRGRNSKISWTQVETGSAITWKYPSCILIRATTRSASSTRSRMTNNYQQADTGTKMIHIGKNTKQHDHLEGHLGRRGQQTYRGLVRIPKAPRRAQLHAVRLAAHRRPVRRPHLPLHRGQELLGPHGARSHHVEDRRRPALLLQLNAASRWRTPCP